MIFSRLRMLLLALAATAGCGDSKPSGSAVPALNGNPSVGQDGRVVVFESGSQVVVVDRVNATSLVIGQNDGVANSVVTPDGRFVAFDARPAGVGARQVFIRNLTTGETTLVSASTVGVPGSGDSTNPSISDDGRFVAFQSNAVDVGARTATSTSVLVRDVAEATTRTAGSPTGGDDINPAISGNGQFVAFESRPLSGFSQVFLFNRLNSGLTPVSRLESGAAVPNGSSGEPSVSGDGRVVAFETRATNLTPATPATSAFAGESNIVVRDVLTGNLVAASVPLSAGIPADGDNRHPTISRDGRRVAFESTATNLTPDVVQPGASNVFLRDLSNDTTELVTRPAAVPLPAASAPPPGGLVTSVPVQPIGTTGALVTTVPVLPGPAATGTPPAPTSLDPVASGDAAVPTPGVASGLITSVPVQPIGTTGALVTSAPVQPIGTTGALVTSAPVQPIAPSGPVTTSAPVEPIGTTGALVTSAPVQPIGTTGALTTSVPVQPIGTASGLVTSAPVGAAGTTSTSTGNTVVLSSIAPPGSWRPNISPDGGWVAYESQGGIYLANLRTGEITAVQRTK
jgi:Tol biopolymer transport system component